MRLVGKQLCYTLSSLFLLRFARYFICCLSLFSPVWTETKWLQGKLQQSKLVRLSSSTMVRLAHTPTSPVTKKCSVDRPIRTQSTESVTDWSNRTGGIGFLPILNTEAWWENTEISPNSQTTSLTNSCLCVLWHFLRIEHKKLLMFNTKLQLQLYLL